MSNQLSEKQKKTLELVRHQAEEILKICQEAEQGTISGEEFEKRISKCCM